VNPISVLAPMSVIAVVAIIASTFVKIARLRGASAESPSAEVAERLDALEREVQGLRQELVETQERLDFAERLLSASREERRISS
jgi:predicted  nucleic acid-binding Zn-ribbon protein